MNRTPKKQEQADTLVMEEVETDVQDPFQLIVWNDEVNTFEWVIETLVEVCSHSYEQAEQCAYIIHFRGKYAVKEGEYTELKPMCDAITERGIGATLETVIA
jgi:ATP-dependent Clp protease adaptor protein ClpS